MSDTPQRDPALELFVVLSRAYTWVNAHAVRDIRCHGLNPTEFGILEVLYHKGPLPLQRIGEKVLISSGNITYAVDKLERKQWLVRKPSPHDRRVIFAELTPQGRDLLAALFPKHGEGIHHVTAVTGNASRNVAFYTQVLGMRLTKKTVNQDDVSACHLFYGDELGRPGTDLTFFEWPDIGSNRPGVGSISTIALGVSGRDALSWWVERFNDFNVSHDGIQTRGAEARLVLPFRDPEGQRLELVDDAGKLENTPWRRSPVPVEMAIHGFYAVRLTLRRLEASERFLTEVLGFRPSGTYQMPHQTSVTIFEVGPGGPGTEVHLEIHPELPFHRFVGIGGVHHVAFRTPNDEEHRQWRDRIARVNPAVTPVIDRFYFRSIYFREPGGVLYELATDGPGFSIDEDVATLGERLSLPPFLEPQRAAIEAHLRPITPVNLPTHVQ